jgi:hypothetical protein
MAIWALCSSSNCDYQLRLHDRVSGVSIPTPLCCPKCDAFLVTYCPACQFPILGTLKPNPLQRCGVCSCDVRRVFVRSNYPRWLTYDRLDSLNHPDWLAPAIKRTDGVSFYLSLAEMARRSYKDDSLKVLLAGFWYVQYDTPDRIDSVTVLLTRPPRFFAVLESQLRHTADLLAARLADGSLLSAEYEFDGEDLSKRQAQPAMALA